MKCDEGFEDTDSNFLGKKICNLRKGDIELLIIEGHQQRYPNFQSVN